MTQKDKVKELVGRGLHSYHTKALQQMNRIEKKNKEQNHKISILTNELNNDYLTKTEEGSVVSLEHSKEGMVYLDELQGNTLVNYCTDGSKELTLNGDIDVEGTFVTTTEGVDNGLVDIMCEGNTLVNLAKNGKEQKDNINWIAEYPLNAIKNSTVYTVVFEICNIVNPDGIQTMEISIENKANYGMYQVPFVNGIYKTLMTTRTNSETSRPSLDTSSTVNFCAWILNKNQPKQTTYSIRNVIVLEGDWTNKEIPPYFEGMKSVGQDDENGHKIEILSNNQNQFRKDLVQNLHVGSSWINENSLRISVNHQAWSGFYYYFDRKKKYWLTYKVNSSITEGEPNTSRVAWYDSRGVLQQWRNVNNTNERVGGVITDAEKIHLGVISTSNTTNELEILDIQITEFETNTYLPTKLNKKEILMNEPLRGLPNGVRDRFVKIGSKWYIERNCAKAIIDGTSQGRTNTSYLKDNEFIMFTKVSDHPIKINGANLISATYKTYDNWKEIYNDTSGEGISNVDNTLGIGIRISNSKTGITSSDTDAQISEKLLEYFQANPVEVIYEPTTPTYEEITDPTLLTYLDTTHISNNSIIPCSMKVQNSGYNAIIKPSTLYTIALDTNKSGTIGMNLGGTKGTTKNNVLTLTTPATLTDDSLRLYGKGIKGSKVRLLEGDKTNWIPSFFEGMISSFEDKLQDDGTYRMEILSNNKNLLDLDKLLNADNYLKGTYSSIRIPLKPNTKYYFNFNFKPNNINRWIGIFSEPLGYNGAFIKTFVWNDNIDKINQGTFITNNSTEYYLSVYQPSVSYNDNNWYKELFTNVYEDFIISQVDDNYIEGKSNKIQFSSIEPLRGVGDVKDRFIFKDGKLMIERNIKERIYNGSEPWGITTGVNGTFKYVTISDDFDIPSVILFDNQLNSKYIVNNPYNLIKNSFWLLNNGGHKQVRFSLNGTETNVETYKQTLRENNVKVAYIAESPTYEETPFELQKIILEGYENGTLFFDTNIPTTVTTTYAGETPIVKATKLNKTEVLNNTNDINDNIIPYLMDMDYRVVCLQLQSENINDGVSMARLFGGTYEMLKRDILSKRLSKEEYEYRLIDYFNAGKLTEEEVRELEDLK